MQGKNVPAAAVSDRYWVPSAQVCCLQPWLGTVGNCCEHALKPWPGAVPISNKTSFDPAGNKFCSVCKVLLLPVQVCWHKFQVYFEIEPRYVPVTVDMPVMTPETAKKYIDENTIGKALPSICCSSCDH